MSSKKVKGTKQTFVQEEIKKSKSIWIKPIKCLNERQKEFQNSIREKEVTICTGLAGSGKAQPLYSTVYTPKGPVKMGDLAIGDLVCTPDGGTAPVINIYPQGFKDCYRVYFSDNTTVDCCDEHLWKVYTESDRNHNREFGKDRFSVLQTKDMIGSVIKRGRKNYKLPITSPVFYEENEELPLDPYLVGALIGDGGMTGSNTVFTSADKEVLDIVSDIVAKYDLIVKPTKDTLRGEKYDYRIVNKVIVSNTKKNYVTECTLALNLRCKSEFKRIPKIYLYSSVENRISLLQGLLDTDGTVCNKSGSTVFSSSSKGLVEDVQELVRSLGGIATLNLKKTKHLDHFTSYINLPNNIMPFRLTRKKDLVIPKTKYLTPRFITNIEFVGKVEQQCISIDSSEHLYLTDNHIVTHNTFLALYNALKLLEQGYKKIILVKSVLTVEDEELGFLPGDISQKMQPFIMSYTGNLNKLIGEKETEQLFKDKVVEVLPLAYIRGINIDESIVLLDECVTGDMQIQTSNSPKTLMSTIVKDFKNNKPVSVWSHNDVTGEVELKKVLNAECTGLKDILEVYIQQRSVPIKTSKNHPFAIYRNGKIEYVNASDLKVNDRLLLRKNGDNNHTIYSDNNLDILAGFVLGDGNIQKNAQATSDIYRIRKTHGMSQLEYCEFSAEILNTTVSFHGKSGYTGETQPTCQTKSLFINPQFISSFYNKGGKKQIYDECEEYFSERTLALWYMDDGSAGIYNDKGANSTLNTQGFSYEEHEILQRILKNKFDLDCRIADENKKDGRHYNFLAFNNENSRKLHNMIQEYIHPSMYYKLLPEFRGNFNKDLYFSFSNLDNITTKLITEVREGVSELVYNIEVEDNNNYFVNGILTHNCQNLTINTFKSIITRIGSNSKYIIMGDTEQIDMKDKKQSALVKVMDLFEDSDLIGTVKFTDEDCVRNPIIPYLLDKIKTLE